MEDGWILEEAALYLNFRRVLLRFYLFIFQWIHLIKSSWRSTTNMSFFFHKIDLSSILLHFSEKRCYSTACLFRLLRSGLQKKLTSWLISDESNIGYDWGRGGFRIGAGCRSARHRRGSDRYGVVAGQPAQRLTRPRCRPAARRCWRGRPCGRFSCINFNAISSRRQPVRRIQSYIQHLWLKTH